MIDAAATALLDDEFNFPPLHFLQDHQVWSLNPTTYMRCDHITDHLGTLTERQASCLNEIFLDPKNLDIDIGS